MNNLKGACFYGGKESLFSDHLMVVISEPYQGYSLAVPISSIKYKDDGTPRYYDKACVLEPTDIKQEDGRNVLTKKSFAFYKEAKEIAASQVIYDQIQKTLLYRCNVTPNILARVQQGAKESSDLEERYEKYFIAF